MVFILVVATFLLFIGIRFLVKAQRRTVPKRVDGEIRSVEPQEPTERLVHPGHCWARVTASGPIRVGIDNFAQQFIGQVDRVDLPTPSSGVQQGDPLVTLHRKNRVLTLVAPLSGKLTAVNPQLATRPEMLNASPYEDGWVAEIVPSNAPLEFHNLMRGITASVWRDALRTQLVQWFVPRLGPVLQDGGQIVDNVGDLLSDDEWEELMKEFFPRVPLKH